MDLASSQRRFHDYLPIQILLSIMRPTDPDSINSLRFIVANALELPAQAGWSAKEERLVAAAPYLIYGGSGGIGAGLATLIARDNAPLHLVARNEKRLETIAAITKASFTTVTDILEEGAVELIMKQVGASSLAGLAYCIGSITFKPLTTTVDADFIDAFRLNVLGAVHAIRGAHRALVAGSGSVVLFSTVAVGRGFPNHSVIAAAKGGVEGLTRALAAELAPSVRVNCIAPSLTTTPLSSPLVANPAHAKALAALHPMRRLGRPEDMAELARFLLSPRSGWITGQIIHVDGGRGALHSS